MCRRCVVPVGRPKKIEISRYHIISHDGSMVLVYMLTWLGYIDGIHGAPYIAAPWILWVSYQFISYSPDTCGIYGSYPIAIWESYGYHIIAYMDPMVIISYCSVLVFLPSCPVFPVVISGCGGRSLGARRLEGLHLPQSRRTDDIGSFFVVILLQFLLVDSNVYIYNMQTHNIWYDYIYIHQDWWCHHTISRWIQVVILVMVKCQQPAWCPSRMLRYHLFFHDHSPYVARFDQGTFTGWVKKTRRSMCWSSKTLFLMLE